MIKSLWEWFVLTFLAVLTMMIVETLLVDLAFLASWFAKLIWRVNLHDPKMAVLTVVTFVAGAIAIPLASGKVRLDP